MPSFSNPPYTAPGLPSANSSPAGGSSKVGQLISGTAPDQLSQLNPTSLSDGQNIVVNFPCSLVEENQSNTLAIHAYPNQPSARVENMGRDPATYHIIAYFTNDIFTGTNEYWQAGLMFDGATNDAALNKMLYLLSLPGNKVFTHPIYGDVTVQVKTWKYRLDAKGPRDGTILDIVMIETIDDSTPLSNTLPPAAGNGSTAAANALDNYISANDPTANPPGLSLGQFFGQLNNLILQTASYPNNVVNALGESVVQPLINGGATIGSGLTSTPGYVLNNMTSTIQSYKDTVLNATTSYNSAIAYDSNATSSFQTSITGKTSIAPATYTATSVSAFQSVTALNNTTSQNSAQLLQKAQTTLHDLHEFYVSQRNPKTSPIIAALRQYLYQVQQIQSSLSANTNNQNLVVTSYVTKIPMSWSSLATFLHNSIDQIMSLNQSLVNKVWIPANTTVYYVSI